MTKTILELTVENESLSNEIKRLKTSNEALQTEIASTKAEEDNKFRNYFQEIYRLKRELTNELDTYKKENENLKSQLNTVASNTGSYRMAMTNYRQIQNLENTKRHSIQRENVLAEDLCKEVIRRLGYRQTANFQNQGQTMHEPTNNYEETPSNNRNDYNPQHRPRGRGREERQNNARGRGQRGRGGNPRRSGRGYAQNERY